ncbi:MAG: hypothetical protein RIC14_05605 [Filomicrobium sp.]
MARKPRKSKVDKRLSQAKAGLVAAEVLGHPTSHAIDAAKQGLGAAQHSSKFAVATLGSTGKIVNAVAGVTSKVALPLTAAYGAYKAGKKYAEGGSAGEVVKAGLDAVSFGAASYLTSGEAGGGAASGRLASRNRQKELADWRRNVAKQQQKNKSRPKPSRTQIAKAKRAVEDKRSEQRIAQNEKQSDGMTDAHRRRSKSGKITNVQAFRTPRKA